jgi:single stranded DNA-binding protein (ssb)
MAKSVNKCFFLGHVGQDPDVRYTPAGDAVTTLSLATSRPSKDQQTGDWIDVTDWHRLVFFKKLAEVVGEYVRKGSRIHVQGYQRTREWRDESRQKKYITEIIVEDLTLLDARDARPSGPSKPSAPASDQRPENSDAELPPSSPPDFDGFDDDIPF